MCHRFGFLFALGFVAVASAEDENTALARVTITALRQSTDSGADIYSVGQVSADEIRTVTAVHPNEIFARIPGVWISRGSGQEHLTAIRSPILTGAGACGAFLFAEDGIPVRPVGFCNVNQLIEINTEQADAIEVLRGPGSALYGANALHGVINILHTDANAADNLYLAAGQYGFGRIAIDADNNTWRLKGIVSRDEAVQDDADYTDAKLWLGTHFERGRDNLRLRFSATRLDQDTAGFIFGRDAYRDDTLRRVNANPEAFRVASSQRLWAHWIRELDNGKSFELRPFLRHSDMEFLQHFLPGKPLEENGQTSAGAIANLSGTRGALRWNIGTDLEWAEGQLEETQADPITQGSPFLIETRPAGKHYDYVVTQLAIAPWTSIQYALSEKTVLHMGLRADWLRYDYDNRMLDGNTRDDGTVCGLGGCLFNRPADRNDEFFTLSPKIGASHALSTQTQIYVNAARGFRPPQATELYRLQRGQNVADLDSERIDSIEIGAHWRPAALFSLDAAAFVMEKANVILRDAQGFNVSAGRTRHRGIEFDARVYPGDTLAILLRGTYAIHRYAFDLQAGGETFVSGNEIDSAPRWIGDLIVQWRPRENQVLEFEWRYLDDYFLDAENNFRYPGHDISNLRWRIDRDEWSFALRVTNLFDTRYAERADFAFGEFRYFPGWERRIFVDLSFEF